MVKRNSIFQTVSHEKVPQSTHNIGYVNKCTMKPGLLYPVYVQPTVPGDVFYGGTGLFMRSEPMVAPLFSNLNVEMRYFWVPNRMVWNNWTYFYADQQKSTAYDGTHSFSGTFPTITLADQDVVGRGSLADFLGVPPHYSAIDFSAVNMKALNALPFRMYWFIWNEYFRDESLMKAVNYHLDDTADTIQSPGAVVAYLPGWLLPVCWKKDRFSSALPWTQKGEDVDLEMLVNLRKTSMRSDDYDDWVTNHAPSFDYYAEGEELGYYDLHHATGVNRDGTTPEGAAIQGVMPGNKNGNIRANMAVNGGFDPVTQDGASQGRTLWYNPNGSLGTEVSIRRIRQAAALQRILEKKAVGGSRYSELILSYFGVRIPDAEIGRPVYLGGGSNPLNISPVEQTASTDATSPQGNLAGKGVSIGSYKFNRPWLFNDHGYVIGVAYVRPEAEYCDGLRRDLFCYDREDFYNPAYQLLGEEQIYQAEVNCNSVNPLGEFGYQQRYAWLKSRENEIHGGFADDNNSNKSYVCPRRFDPSREIFINGSFVECNPDMTNNFAYSGADYFLAEFNHMVIARRPMYYVPIQRPGLL